MSLEDRLYSLLSLYERLPHPVRRAVGQSYARLPSRWRLGARYSEFKDLARLGEHWSLAEAQTYQLTQLRSVLAHANASCAFYQRRFAEAGFNPDSVGSLSDIQQCPTVE